MAGVDLDDRKYVPLLGCDSEVDEVLEVYFLSYRCLDVSVVEQYGVQ